MSTNDVFIWMNPWVCRSRQDDVRAYSVWVEERLVPSFGTWDDEEERARDDYFASMSNLEYHDVGAVYEDAYEHAIDHCLIHAEVNSYMMAMAISGLYHLWEKQVLEHLEREISRYTEHYKPPKNWSEICEYFAKFSTDLYSLPFSLCMEELRLVTNISKHGIGDSFDWLRASDSDILNEATPTNEMLVTGGMYSMLRAPIYPRVEHFLRYKQAVLMFWDYEFWRRHGEKLYHAG
jgi:hypothetical protein